MESTGCSKKSCFGGTTVVIIGGFLNEIRSLAHSPNFFFSNTEIQNDYWNDKSTIIKTVE